MLLKVYKFGVWIVSVHRWRARRLSHHSQQEKSTHLRGKQQLDDVYSCIQTAPSGIALAFLCSPIFHSHSHSIFTYKTENFKNKSELQRTMCHIAPRSSVEFTSIQFFTSFSRIGKWRFRYYRPCVDILASVGKENSGKIKSITECLPRNQPTAKRHPPNVSWFWWKKSKLWRMIAWNSSKWFAIKSRLWKSNCM